MFYVLKNANLDFKTKIVNFDDRNSVPKNFKQREIL
jgi:hypothetical protein